MATTFKIECRRNEKDDWSTCSDDIPSLEEAHTMLGWMETPGEVIDGDFWPSDRQYRIVKVEAIQIEFFESHDKIPWDY